MAWTLVGSLERNENLLRLRAFELALFWRFRFGIVRESRIFEKELFGFCHHTLLSVDGVKSFSCFPRCESKLAKCSRIALRWQS